MVKAEIRASIDMKDSGLDWIEYIPKEWRVMPLKRYFQFGKGLPITKADLTETGAKVISYGQIHAKYNTGVAVDDRLVRYVPRDYLATNPVSLCSKGDIIMADTSEDKEGCGNAVYINCDEGIFAGYHTIILKSAEDNKYLAYLFQSDAWRSQIRTRVNGVKLYSITQRILSQCNIVLPPLAEQRAIAAYLDKVCGTIDEIMAEARASIEEYKQLKQSVIFEAVTKGLDKDVEMKDSGVEWIGKIPKGWSLRKINSLFETIGSGTTPNSHVDEYYQGNVNWLQSGDINGAVVETTKKCISKEILSNTSALTVYTAPFIAMAMYGASIGNISIVGIDACTNQACCVLANPIKDIDMHYAFWGMMAAKEELVLSARGGGQPNISQNIIKQLRISVPCLGEQKAIADFLDKRTATIDSLISEKESLISDLAAYKKSFIYELVTGKRRVV